MSKAPTLDEFELQYIGDPKFLKEAHQWFLLGRLDAMMQSLKREENRNGSN